MGCTLGKPVAEQNEPRAKIRSSPTNYSTSTEGIVVRKHIRLFWGTALRVRTLMMGLQYIPTVNIYRRIEGSKARRRNRMRLEA